MEKKKSKISNIEWGLLIAALFTIDLVQIGLEWLLIGFATNPVMDLYVGMALPFYLYMRGEDITSGKRLSALIGTFVAEMIPVIDELPLWGLEGIYMMLLSKSDKVMEQVSSATNVIPMTPNRPQTKQTDNNDQQKAA